MIAWTDEILGQKSSDFQLLIQCRNGFSDRLRLCRQPSTVIVDGPYGKETPLKDFDKILFIAAGGGIAAHLLAIRQLLQAHEDRTARCRRLSLLWVLEDQAQERWAEPFISLLLETDRRRIFTVLIAAPGSAPATPVLASDPDRSTLKHSRLFRMYGEVDIRWLIQQEWSAEAGNMAISLCGTPLFEQHVRRALRYSPLGIHLYSSPFQMDESTSSEHNANRLVMKSQLADY
ncbi:hypothetical protein NU195Hw_Modified_187t1 [Hortaea werneckii]